MANVIKGGLVGPTALQAREQARAGFRQSMGQLSALGNEIQQRKEARFTNWIADVYTPALAAVGNDPVELAKRNPNLVTQYNSFLGPRRRAADTTAALAAGDSSVAGIDAGAAIDFTTGRLRKDVPVEYHAAMDEANRTGDTSALSKMLPAANPELLANINNFFAASSRSGNAGEAKFGRGYATQAPNITPLTVSPYQAPVVPTYVGGLAVPPQSQGFPGSSQQTPQQAPSQQAPSYIGGPAVPAQTQGFPGANPQVPLTRQPMSAADQYAAFIAMQRREAGLPVLAEGGVVPGNPQASLAAYDQATGEQHSPAMVSDAEFIMNPQAVKQFGPILKMMNDAAPNPAATLAPTSIPGAPVFAEGGNTGSSYPSPAPEPALNIEQMTVSTLFDYKKSLEAAIASSPHTASGSEVARKLAEVNETIEAFRPSNLDGVTAPTSGTPTNLAPVTAEQLAAVRASDAADALAAGQSLAPNLTPASGQAGKNVPRDIQGTPGIVPYPASTQPSVDPGAEQERLGQLRNAELRDPLENYATYPINPADAAQQQYLAKRADSDPTNPSLSPRPVGPATPVPAPIVNTDPVVAKITEGAELTKKEEGKMVQDTAKASRWIAGHVGNASSMATAAQSERFMNLFYPEGLTKLDLFQSARDVADLELRARDTVTRESGAVTAAGNLEARNKELDLSVEDRAYKQKVFTESIRQFDKQFGLEESKLLASQEYQALVAEMEANTVAWVDQAPENKRLWSEFEYIRSSEQNFMNSIAKDLGVSVGSDAVIKAYQLQLAKDPRRLSKIKTANQVYYQATGLIEPEYKIEVSDSAMPLWLRNLTHLRTGVPQQATLSYGDEAETQGTTVPTQAATLDLDAQADALANEALY